MAAAPLGRVSGCRVVPSGPEHSGDTVYHHDIMQSIMSERGGEMRARAEAERDARSARQAREFWADHAERVTAVRRTRRHGAAPAR